MRNLGGLLLIFAAAALPLQSQADSARDDELRFAVMRFSHETCTFCPGGDTGLERWTGVRRPYVGDEVLDSDSYIRGFVAAASEYDNITLIGLESPARVYGDSSASWNTQAVFEQFVSKAMRDLERALPVDGVYLSLHGAMAVRNVPRPEAELARRVRAIVGPDVPIVATFDLHGNEDAEFLRWADMAFATKRYPHYDTRLQGARAARSLVRIARGLYDPVSATRKPPLITPTLLQWTGKSPAREIMERARRWEERAPGVFVSVLFGFPWSDVPDVGTTIHVMTNDDRDLAERIADDMAAFVWRSRHAFFEQEVLQPEEAVKRAITASASGNGPVVLADYSDRSGDATHILEQIIEQGMSGVAVASIRDESLIKRLRDKPLRIGGEIRAEVGGFVGAASGRPILVQGKLVYFGPGMGYEHMAIIEFGDRNALFVTPALEQVNHPDELDLGPVQPHDFDAFVVKSRVHFRRGFDETGFAETILIVDAPGHYIGTVHLEHLPYENVELDDFYPYGSFATHE